MPKKEGIHLWPDTTCRMMKKCHPILQVGCLGKGCLPVIVHILVLKSATRCHHQAGKRMKALIRSSVHNITTENWGTGLIQDILKEEDRTGWIMDIIMKNMVVNIKKGAPFQRGTRMHFFPPLYTSNVDGKERRKEERIQSLSLMDTSFSN